METTGILLRIIPNTVNSLGKVLCLVQSRWYM